MTADLLTLLRRVRPDATEADIDALPDRAPRTPARSRCGSRPITAASVARRRSWAAAGRLPPALAARFTLGEAAVLAVVAVEVTRHGSCTLTIPHVAALAGVSETTVRNAVRAAKALGILAVEERRLSAWRNLPNRLTITSPEWRSWLRLGRKGEGAISRTPRLQESYLEPSRGENRSERVFGKAGAKRGGCGQ